MLLNPHRHDRYYPDEASRDLMRKTIDFFEQKGKARIKKDDQERVWYADFLEYQKQEKLFATLLTPAHCGGPGARWDTWRICEFNEILAFYGLPYWYTWQVSILGLGPIWMSGNEEARRKAAGLLDQGAVFAFGLSEKDHGADIYSTEMTLSPQTDGTWRANGRKYYIGNGNAAEMVSTFGKVAGSGEYAFFVANYAHRNYECVRNVVNSQNFVSEFGLHDYPVTAADILHVGQEAWDAALNTVNIGKYNLGWASIGICEHAFYEAISHAAHRRLYGMHVTDFPHVRQLFVDAWARLVAMKLFALRAADYMRVASPDDRRYLLYNPVMKMKVTTQGEEVINLLWDVIAAKGFEKDTYFEMAARDIRAMPKLEGTVHVNIALIVKFMMSYFTNPAPFEPVPRQDRIGDDSFLFRQGPAKGLGRVRFHDFRKAFAAWDLPNVRIFQEQTRAFMEMGVRAPADEAQQKDVDFLLAVGEIFTLIVYGQLILENATIYGQPPEVVDQIFDFMVRDLSRFAVTLHGRQGTSAKQAEFCLRMV
ncbi:MAG: acyl-CoA dehydrogenase, partial [Deltaproteobacteria bacterium]|nr:acyl-CoA dehydrogenase [Deltaproteobacteria bacterium]